MNQDDVAKCILRVTLGGLLLCHGWFKLTHGISGIEQMLLNKGYPAFLAWGVYVGEVVAPLMVLVGFYTRTAALLIVANMLVAIALAHMGQLSGFGRSGGWMLELQAFYLSTAVCVFLLGSGRAALRKSSNWLT